MARQAGFWSVDDRLVEISLGGDPLETLNATVDFECVRPNLARAAGRARSPKGGRASLDVVLTFKMLVLQSLHGLSLAPTGRMVRDRLSWMRFCGLGIIDTVPDANTLWNAGGAHQGRRARRVVRGSGPGDQSGRVHPARWSDHRRQPHRSPAPTQLRRRDGGDQGGQDGVRDLAGQACQGGTKGHERALDRAVFQGQDARGRQQTSRPRDPDLRRQKPHRH